MNTTLETLKGLTVEQINEQLKQLRELKNEISPKKETPSHTIEKRQFSNDMYNELLTFSKTSKAVKAYLKLIGLEGLKSMMSEKQLSKADFTRLEGLIKSPSKVAKMFTPKQYLKFKVDGNKVTPNNYLNAIISGLTLSQNSWDKRRSAKTHYSIEK